MKKVLIIEDEVNIAMLERDYLTINGLEAEIVTRGDVGLRKAKTGDYDLAIVDLMLPGMDGFEICRQVREALDIPLIVVSARQEDIDKIRALGLGADDYVTKPFSPSELVARVKAHLSRYERLTASQEAKRNEIKIRGIQIDQYARRVFVNNREIELTTKEYDLLVFLASNPDRVFNKEELFERIWGMDSLGEISTLTVHIRRLREKIEMDPGKPQYIETIWGVGYRFIA